MSNFNQAVAAGAHAGHFRTEPQASRQPAVQHLVTPARHGRVAPGAGNGVVTAAILTLADLVLVGALVFNLVAGLHAPTLF